MKKIELRAKEKVTIELIKALKKLKHDVDNIQVTNRLNAKKYRYQLYRLKMSSNLPYYSRNLSTFPSKPFKPVLKKWKLKQGFIFFINPKEKGHNIPHFHVEISGEGNGSYKIEDCSVIHTTFRRKINNKIKAWHSEHKLELIDTWNHYQKEGITIKLS